MPRSYDRVHEALKCIRRANHRVWAAIDPIVKGRYPAAGVQGMSELEQADGLVAAYRTYYLGEGSATYLRVAVHTEPIGVTYEATLLRWLFPEQGKRTVLARGHGDTLPQALAAMSDSVADLALADAPAAATGGA